jgi:hypothetical protein
MVRGARVWVVRYIVLPLVVRDRIGRQLPQLWRQRFPHAPESMISNVRHRLSEPSGEAEAWNSCNTDDRSRRAFPASGGLANDSSPPFALNAAFGLKTSKGLDSVTRGSSQDDCLAALSRRSRWKIRSPRDERLFLTSADAGRSFGNDRLCGPYGPLL